MLEVKELSASYGKHRALESVSLKVVPGEIVVILGANGAGKSTLLKSICGICEGAVHGDVLMGGTELSGLKPNKIVEEGIALVPEGRGVFPDLTVQENLLLGSYSERARDEEGASLERVLNLFPKLAERQKQVVRTMSGGEQQMVAIGRAMMSNPTILALDEPSLGLSPLLSKELFHSLKRVKAAGLGILMVEQNARQSLAIADRGYLLENGRIAHQDSADNLLNDPAVTAAYLGGKSAPRAKTTTRATEPTLSVRAGTEDRAFAQIASQAMASFEGSQIPKKPVSEEVTPVFEVANSPASITTSKPAETIQPSPTVMPESRPISTLNLVYGMDLEALVESASAQSSRKGTASEAGRLPTRPQHRSVNRSTSTEKVVMPSLDSSADRLQTILREIEEAARRAEQSRKL